MRYWLIHFCSFCSFCVILLVFISRAHAYDQQVSSVLWAEGYSIPAGDGTLIIRRNIVEDLHLAAWNLLPNSDDPYYEGIRLSVEIKLRLNTDFGIGKAESTVSDSANFVPGLTPLQVDPMFAYIDISGLWDGALDVRLGRQIRLDTLGFFAFDGIEAQVNMPVGFFVSAFLGYEVRGGNNFGYDQLELDGVASGNRLGMDDSQYADMAEPSPRLSFGAQASWIPNRWFDSSIAVVLVGLSQEIARQNFGASVAIGNSPVKGSTRIIWNPMMDNHNDIAQSLKDGTFVTQADTELAFEIKDDIWLSLQYQLYRPVFDAGSIFNIFDLMPRRDLNLRLEVNLKPSVSVASWGGIKMADDSAGIDGQQSDSFISGVTGGIGANYYSETRRLSTRLIAAKQWGEQQLGFETGASQGFYNNRIWLGLRGSYWHIDDDFSNYLSGNIFGYVTSIKFKLAKNATVIGELENYFGGGRKTRFVGLLLLQLDLWR